MDVRIGVIYTARDIELDMGNVDPEKLVAGIEQALADENGILWLTDKRGRKVGVPVSKLAYVELGSPFEDRKVGFGAH